MTRRELRRLETARLMREAARRMTAEHGLAGFTVEQLCDEVGVSRRTFFNYFASKENAVIGIPVRVDESAEEEFLAAGPAGVDGLFGDLIDLQLKRWQQLDISPADIEPMLQALFREPSLLKHMLEQGSEAERRDVELVEQREGLPAGDLRAAAAVHILAAVSRASVEQFFQPENDDELRTIVERRLAAAREVFGA
jgi:AcrR family transcriptional regulator